MDLPNIPDWLHIEHEKEKPVIHLCSPDESDLHIPSCDCTCHHGCFRLGNYLIVVHEELLSNWRYL